MRRSRSRRKRARSRSKSRSRSRKRARSKSRPRRSKSGHSSRSSRSHGQSPSKKRKVKQKAKHKTGHKKPASRASAEGARLAERQQIEKEAEAEAQAKAKLAEKKAAEARRLEEKAAAEERAKAAAEPTAKVANEERAKQMSESLANLGKGYEKNWEGKACEKKKKKKAKDIEEEESEKEETKPREKRSKRSDEANTGKKLAKSAAGKEQCKSKKVAETEDKGKVETPVDPQSVPKGKPKVKAVKKDNNKVANEPIEGKEGPKEVNMKARKQEKASSKKKATEADTKDPKDKKHKADKDGERKAKKVEGQEAPKVKAFKCHVGQTLQYLSSKYNAWVPCKVLAVDGADAVQINLKPGYWFKDNELRAKLRLENDASADPGAGRCGMCSKRVAKEAGGIGGVICRRKRDDKSGFVGCGKGLCWKCMPQADEIRFGKVRPRKEDVEELEETMRKSFWWMHEACMTAVDTTDYAVQMMPPVPQ